MYLQVGLVVEYTSTEHERTMAHSVWNHWDSREDLNVEENKIDAFGIKILWASRRSEGPWV